ncbi:unnamed protein product [Orchesella dallaii]|uniref:Secreted protein n=1 Tax=Orchesella dallaii TaxID=48710 RepID=A0ABP1R2I5_9HEXA
MAIYFCPITIYCFIFALFIVSNYESGSAPHHQMYPFAYGQLTKVNLNPSTNTHTRTYQDEMCACEVDKTFFVHEKTPIKNNIAACLPLTDYMRLLRLFRSIY